MCSALLWGEASVAALAAWTMVLTAADAPARVMLQVLDVLTSIGLSDSLLRMIDRRQRLDAIIVYGGMLLVVVVLLMLWWFFRA